MARKEEIGDFILFTFIHWSAHLCYTMDSIILIISPNLIINMRFGGTYNEISHNKNEIISLSF